MSQFLPLTECGTPGQRNQPMQGPLGSGGGGGPVPDAPLYLYADAITSSRIDLAWIDNSDDETGFRIYRSWDGMIFTAIDTVAAGVTAYSSTGLNASRIYYYYVVAYNAGGESAASNTAIEATFAAAPVAGSVLWLDAGLGTYQDVAHTTPAVLDGAVVGYWEDQSGNGNHATAVSDGTQRPTLQLNELNSLPVIRGDGANDYMRTINYLNLTALTALFVIVPRQIAAERIATHYDGSDGWYCQNGATETYKHLNPTVTLLGSFTLDAPALITVQRGGGAMTLRLNGAEVDTTALAAPATDAYLWLWSNHLAGGNSQIDIAEVLVYDSVLGAADLATAEGYLLGRYEIGEEKDGGLVAWLDAGLGTYQDVAGTTPAVLDGAVVGRWEDQTGKHNHWTSVTDGTQRPTLQLNELNALPVIQADGVDDYLRSVNEIWLGEFTLTLALRLRERGDYRILYQYDGTDGWYLVPNDPQVGQHLTPNVTAPGCLNLGTANIFSFQRTATEIVCRRNGEEIDTGATATSVLTVDEIFMFVDNVYAHDTALDVAELILRRGNNAVRMAHDERYLADRYASPLVTAPTWTQRADMPGAREQHGFEECGGLLYVCAGISAAAVEDDLWAYDPDTNLWDNTLAVLPSVRQSPILRAVGGKLYCIGGLVGNNITDVTGAVHEYDPGGDAWVAKTAKPTPVEDFGSAVWDGKIYCFGGLKNVAGTPTPTDVLEIYDPSGDSWDQTKASMPANKWSGDFGCAYNGKVYAAGSAVAYAGYPAMTPVTTLYEYEIATDTWTPLAAMPEGQCYKELEVVGGYIYMVSGTVTPNATTYTYAMWRYDIAGDVWEYVGAAPNAVGGAALAQWDGEIYMSGGIGTGGRIDELWRLTP